MAEFPFTTRFPTPGMLAHEDVQIQLVDLPPAIRSAHAGVLVVDVNDAAVLDEIEFIFGILERFRLPAPKLLLGNKVDVSGGEDNFATLAELFQDRFARLYRLSGSRDGLMVEDGDILEFHI